jgi:hypothetical protein
MLPKAYGINYLECLLTLWILFRSLLALMQPALSTAFFFSVFSFTKQFFYGLPDSLRREAAP